MKKMMKYFLIVLLNIFALSALSDESAVEANSKFDRRSINPNVSDESATEAGALCVSSLLCEDSDPSLSRLVEFAPITESISQNSCPQFIIKEQLLRDEKSSLTADSPDEICSSVTASSVDHFKSAGELEAYLQDSPFFSDLSKSSSASPVSF